MIVQVYEIADPEEAVAMAALGVDHLGVLVGRGAYPREIGLERAAAIFRALPEQTLGVALCLSSEVPEILEVAERTLPDILHLGALPERLPPEDVRRVAAAKPHLRIMRSIPVLGEASIQTAQAFAMTCHLLLLDSLAAGDSQVGATGATHDWALSRRIVQSVDLPVFLAGGLGPKNVTEAIEAVGPAGVDSKTRTDRPGAHRKDPEAVRAFVRLAKAARFGP